MPSVYNTLEETIATALQQSDALRQSILKKAFKGALVAQDPKDEPASKLLKRIKADRERYEEKSATRKKINPEGMA